MFDLRQYLTQWSHVLYFSVCMIRWITRYVSVCNPMCPCLDSLIVASKALVFMTSTVGTLIMLGRGNSIHPYLLNKMSNEISPVLENLLHNAEKYPMKSVEHVFPFMMIWADLLVHGLPLLCVLIDHHHIVVPSDMKKVYKQAVFISTLFCVIYLCYQIYCQTSPETTYGLNSINKTLVEFTCAILIVICFANYVMLNPTLLEPIKWMFNLDGTFEQQTKLTGVNITDIPAGVIWIFCWYTLVFIFGEMDLKKNVNTFIQLINDLQHDDRV